MPCQQSQSWPRPSLTGEGAEVTWVTQSGKMTPSQHLNTTFRTIISVLLAVQGCRSESIFPWRRREEAEEAPDRPEGSEASALGKEKADI